MDRDEQADFKIKAKQFVKIYAQVACILSFANPAWEKLHWFLKFLIPKQRVKFINIARHVMDDASYQTQVLNNPDQQNSKLALEKLISNAVCKERRKELELYRNYAQDPEFKWAFYASMPRWRGYWRKASLRRIIRT